MLKIAGFDFQGLENIGLESQAVGCIRHVCLVLRHVCHLFRHSYWGAGIGSAAAAAVGVGIEGVGNIVEVVLDVGEEGCLICWWIGWCAIRACHEIFACSFAWRASAAGG